MHEVTAMALEHGVGTDPHVHVKVAGRTATRPHRPSTAKPQGRALVDPGPNVDGERLLLYPTTLAPARTAGVRDDLPSPTTGRTRRGGHHLAQQ